VNCPYTLWVVRGTSCGGHTVAFKAEFDLS